MSHSSPRVVSDVMTHTVVAVGRDASFKEIVELFDQWRVSALPVLEGEGRVVGVVSEADLLAKEEFRGGFHGLADDPRERAKADAVTAGELMTSPAVTVRADASLADAARVMVHRRVKRLPVVDAVGVLQGVVSRGDLLTVFLRPDADIAAEIRRTVLAPVRDAPDVTVTVSGGVVTLGGVLRDMGLVPVLAEAARAVEGVVDVRLDLTRP